jgi:hypothetical protein
MLAVAQCIGLAAEHRSERLDLNSFLPVSKTSFFSHPPFVCQCGFDGLLGICLWVVSDTSCSFWMDSHLKRLKSIFVFPIHQARLGLFSVGDLAMLLGGILIVAICLKRAGRVGSSVKLQAAGMDSAKHDRLCNLRW